MQSITLYRYHREDGGVTNSISQPENIEYTLRYRLIASEGKALTNGDQVFFCIDVDTADGWGEIDYNWESSEDS